MPSTLSGGVVILVLCLIITCFVEYSLALTRTTSGTSGEVCEGGFRKCMRRQADCIDGKCICKRGAQWRGDFACYPRNHFHAEILNDPNLQTFARDFVRLPVPCRYLFTHFRTVFTGWRASTCEVFIHAFNAKRFGKVYVHGFDIALRVSTPVSSPPVGDISVRKFGNGTDETYTFEEYGALHFSPDGPWVAKDTSVSIYLPGGYIKSRYDPYNNLGYMEVDKCGFRINFRPMDLKYGKDQVQVPGISLSVDPNFRPEWLSPDKVMALPPVGEPTLSSVSREANLDPPYAMIQRLFLTRASQNQPNAAPQCDRVPEVISSCPESRKAPAFETCTFILTTERLSRCHDPSENGDKILELFKDCFKSICDSSSPACTQVQDKVRKCQLDEAPEVDAFLNSNTCTF